MIAGLEEITAAPSASATGWSTTCRPDRDIAMVFQNYALYPHMSVREHGLRPHAAEAAQRGRSTGAWRRPPGSWASTSCSSASRRQLSGRPAAARGGGPRHRAPAEVFLFDEPLSNLDAKLRVQMRVGTSRRSTSRLNATTIYVTHDQVEAMTLGDRIVVMKDGRVQQVDRRSRSTTDR
jgi:ABC-type sugar transport system ATPase subunit